MRIRKGVFKVEPTPRRFSQNPSGLAVPPVAGQNPLPQALFQFSERLLGRAAQWEHLHR